MITAVIFKSDERFSSFRETLEAYGVKVVVLDFARQGWIDFDYTGVDLVIYYPSFKYTSNHPLALYEAHDNLMHLSSAYPHLRMYPDTRVIWYYNDKFRQYLFLNRHNYPIPKTYPLLSSESVELADKVLGYPMIVKNRYGAGGGYVFRVWNKKELEGYYGLSTLNMANRWSVTYMLRNMSKRMFLFHLLRVGRMAYPFLSPPLLAQKYIPLDRDLKTVVGNDEVVEAHWRYQANASQWKVNIDGGGVGVWEKVPEDAINLSLRIAKELGASWLNIDMITENGKFLISEFSPVWHHYKYKEKPTFLYKDDYNIRTPLEVSLDLEKIIVESLLRGIERKET